MILVMQRVHRVLTDQPSGPTPGSTQVPVLADTLRADTVDVVQGAAKHDMAEAIEHVVCGIGDVREELHEAFLARDPGRTGALGGAAFKVCEASKPHARAGGWIFQTRRWLGRERGAIQKLPPKDPPITKRQNRV